ncbi:MAG: double-strand break repair helicase AddA [Alphaproteobacteria bacterium]|nr:double-strand break repair helicase AddA [Alphaproteobacteria bacterium]
MATAFPTQPGDEASLRQREAADPAASVWVAASAGSGKTKVLTDRLLNLLLAGSRPERLLCLTFTKAAAAEMATRLSEKLSSWTVMPEEGLLAELRALGDREPSQDRLLKARRLFAEVLDAPGGLKIQTIHAFAQSLLGRFPLEAGVPPNFHLADERAAEVLLAEAERRVLDAAGAGLDPVVTAALSLVTARVDQTRFRELLRAVLSRRARLAALFAESGGVDAAVGRVYAALGADRSATDADLLAVAGGETAFDRAALRHMAEALSRGAKTDQGRSGIMLDWLSAPDSEGRALHWEAYRGVYLTAEGGVRKTLASKGAREHNPAIDALMAREAERVWQVEEARRAAATAERTGALLVLAAAVIEAYENEKVHRAALDYDDLVRRARDLLDRPGVAAWVLFKLDGGLDHILIDEAQDTSPAQWEIVRALAEEFFAGFGARAARDPGITRTIFAVGDVKQSIYSFQGADPAGFTTARDHFAERVLAAEQRFQRIPLQVSFRSTGAVLAAVDAVFAQAEARDGVAEDDFPIEHRAFRDGQAGRVEVWPTLVPADAEDGTLWSPPLQRVDGDEPRRRLAQLLAERIQRWILDKDRLPARNRPIRAGDVMILVQRRGAFVGEVVAALKTCGVPVAGVDRMALTEPMAVRDLIALGQAILLPNDDLTLATVLKSPLIGLSEEDLYDLCHDRREPRVWHELRRRAGETGPLANADRRFLEWVGLADRLPPHEFYQRVLARGGRERLVARLGPEAEDAIDEFLAQTLAYERDHAPSLQGFLHWLAASAFVVKRELEGGSVDQVRVMTVHGAKGLQAPIVILPDTLRVPRLQDQVLWHRDAAGIEVPLWTGADAGADRVSAAARAVAKARQLEEYRRLLYVAMTRAEDRLIVCGWDGRRAATVGNWYGLIRDGLAGLATPMAIPGLTTGGDAHGLVFESRQTATPPSAEAAGASGDLDPLPEWALRPPREAEPRPPSPLAPTPPTGEEPAVRSPLDADDGRRFKRGSLLHRLLQMLPELPAERRAEAGRRFLARPIHAVGAADAEEWLAEALAVLDDPAFAPMFAAGSRAEVPIVGVVSGPDGPEVVSRRIDRMAVTDEAVLVVDFKTNRPPPRSIDAVPDIYLRQMATYRTLLAGLYPDRPVRAALLWTDGPRLMALPEDVLVARGGQIHSGS